MGLNVASSASVSSVNLQRRLNKNRSKIKSCLPYKNPRTAKVVTAAARLSCEVFLEMILLCAKKKEKRGKGEREILTQ